MNEVFDSTGFFHLNGNILFFWLHLTFAILPLLVDLAAVDADLRRKRKISSSARTAALRRGQGVRLIKAIKAAIPLIIHRYGSTQGKRTYHGCVKRLKNLNPIV